MSEPKFPVPAEHIAQTLIALLGGDSSNQFVWLLESATPILVHEGYSSYGGEYEMWRLKFEVPVERFAHVESRIEELEGILEKKVRHISKGFTDHQISSVVLTPRLIAQIAKAEPQPPDADIERIWGQDKLRIFISHRAEDKIFLSELKEDLKQRGIAALLAHEDIKPTKEWQREIELALRSMEGMVVFLTTNFANSEWTEQEVGWAMGRGVFILPIKVDIDPYGFMGKLQALRGQKENSFALAGMITELLIKQPQTRDAMRWCLVNAFRGSRNFDTSKLLRNYLMLYRDFTEEEKNILREACTVNGQVSGAWGVADSIYTLVGKPLAVSADDEPLPF